MESKSSWKKSVRKKCEYGIFRKDMDLHEVRDGGGVAYMTVEKDEWDLNDTDANRESPLLTTDSSSVCVEESDKSKQYRKIYKTKK
jgi:hypothetical protein